MTADELIARALEAVRGCYSIVDLSEPHHRLLSDAGGFLRRVLNERAGRDANSEWPPRKPPTVEHFPLTTNH